VVFCTKCGTNNVDTASVCVNCGAPLFGASDERKPRVTRYDREYSYHRRGRPLVGIFIGLIIILAGFGLLLSELYGIDIPWGPIILILIGVFILVRLLLVRRRRR
jgi:tetrahydromethanopterin S-methyltransferase subunit E